MRRLVWLATFAAFAAFGSLDVLVVGCGGDDGVTPTDDAGAPLDGGVDDGVTDPAPPALPVLTPCPDGTELRDGGDVMECWPLGDTCTSGVRFLGETACAPVGAACPVGDFPDDAPAGAVYVLAGASGDGSRASPLGSIATALVRAGRDGTVVVGPGTYDGALDLHDATLRGACAERTTLISTAPDDIDGVLNATGGAVVIRDLTVGASSRGGIAITRTSTRGQLVGVVVEATTAFGVYVDLSASADIDGLVVRDTVGTAAGRFGDGLVIDTGASATARRVLVSHSRSTGVHVLGGATLSIESLIVRDIEVERGTMLGGRGLVVKAGSTATVDMISIERARDTAIEVRDAGTTLTLRDGWVLETALHTDGERGRAVTLLDGATASFDRVILESMGDAALIATGGAHISIHDAIVRGVRGNATGAFGRFTEILDGSSLEGGRLWLENANDIGVSAAGAGSAIDLSDTTIEDVSVLDAVAPSGRGLNIQAGAAATLTRVRAHAMRNSGVFVDEATLVADDLDIEGVEMTAGTRRGRGISVQRGSMVTLTRARVANVFDVGLFVAGAASLVATDTEVRNVVSPPCDADCGTDPGGIGVGAYDNQATTLTRFMVDGATLCGIHLADAGELDLADGTVRGSTIGACVQVDGYDIDRLSRVRFVANGTPLEATNLPVPAAEPASGAP